MITKDSEVVIIGTSFIGMEVAMAVLKKEPKSVNMVGVDEIPFEAILGKEIGTAIMEVSFFIQISCHCSQLTRSDDEEGGC
jgi:hypothetical protein